MHAQSPLPMRIERFGLDDDSLSIAKKAVKLGNLWERGKDLNRLKIAPLFFQPVRENVSGVRYVLILKARFSMVVRKQKRPAPIALFFAKRPPAFKPSLAALTNLASLTSMCI